MAASGAEFTYNHFGDVMDELESRILAGLEACGLRAEARAKALCPVDTGRLRNSITHVVSGSGARTHVYTISNRSKYDKNSYDRSGRMKTVDSSVLSEGTRYENIPSTNKKPYTVWIGTNVEYGIYIELGCTVNGKVRPPRRYIKPALADYIGDYETIMKYFLFR